MSKAFTKDDDGAGEAPLVLSRRPPLPVNTPNYVTRRGLALLQAELEAEPAISPTSAESPRALSSARRAELEARIASAVLVEAGGQSQDRVRFGARVTLRARDGSERSYRIVGVDEANPEEHRIAFTAPLSRALLGKEVGEVVRVQTPAGEDELELLAVDYRAEEPAAR